ncbi:MAG: MBL fold metallo-hydrolase [Betaproteobacteria bacterium]|nr:MBL fold metallo-hydrolase [Betaproteobacteria bacterium]
MRFASLASGSKGNCLVAECGATRVLLDCGLSARETERRLARLGLVPSDISAILVTHEHSDHLGSAFEFAARHAIEVRLTHGTLRSAQESGKREASVRVEPIVSRDPIAIGDLQVQPYTVPHDAREPVQFTFSDGALRLGVLTDIGAPTAHVVQMLSGCDALVLECNHALDLLWNGGYPRWLKERIAGPLGHLDNGASAQLLGAVDRSRLRHVIAAHLSEQNNRPELAQRALANVLGCEERDVPVATQEEGFGWREIR